MSSHLEKLRSYKLLNMTCCYLDILESISPTSKIFEVKNLLPYEVMPVLKETLANIGDILEETDDSNLSHVATFSINGKQLATTCFRGDDKRRKKVEQEKIEILLDNFTELTKKSVEFSINNKKALCKVIKEIIECKFEHFEDPVFNNMIWFDPKNWDNDDKSYGNEQLKCMSKAFAAPLRHASFNEATALKEWKSLKNFVNAIYNYSAEDGPSALKIWEKICKYKRREFPNMCLLAQIIMCLSASNSTVERAFSLLTLLLSDRRLSMNHSIIQDLITINLSDKNWCDVERDEILEQAVEKYLKKRRTTSLSELPTKRIRLDDDENAAHGSHVSFSSESESDSSDSDASESD